MKTKKTKSKLENLKNDEVAVICSSQQEEPVFTVYSEDCDIDSNIYEEPISWEQLKVDPVGTVYSADCKSGCSLDKQGTATIVFEDDSGIVVLFKRIEYHTHRYWDNHPKYKVEESEEWIERFTFL